MPQHAILTPEPLQGAGPVYTPVFDAFMRAAPVIAFIKDGEGRILYVNGLVENLWGKTLPELEGKGNDELWPSEIAKQLRAQDLQVLTTGQRVEAIESLPLPDGSERNFQVIKFLYSDEAGSPLVGGIGIDVTRNIEAEERLEKKVRLQGVIARLASQALVQSNVAAFLEETAILVSQVLEVEYFGYFDFPDGRPILRAGVGWDPVDLGTCLHPSEDSQIAYTYRYGEPLRIFNRVTTSFVLPELLVRHGVQASVTDVVRTRTESFGVLGAFAKSERKWSSDELHFLTTVGALIGGKLMRFKVESELNESEASYRELFEDAPAAYHELDCTGRIRKVNRTECQLLGYTESELLGRLIWELVDERERATSEAAVIGKLNGTRQPTSFSRPYLHRDGTRMMFQISERLIKHLGQITGICSIMVPVL